MSANSIVRSLNRTKQQILAIEITHDHYTSVTIADSDVGRAAHIQVALADLQYAVGGLSYKDAIEIVEVMGLKWSQRYHATEWDTGDGPGPKPEWLTQSYHEGYTAALTAVRNQIQDLRPQ